MFNSDEWCERNEHSNMLCFYANLSVLSDINLADVNLSDPERRETASPDEEAVQGSKIIQYNCVFVLILFTNK